MTDDRSASIDGLDLAYRRRQANHPGQPLCPDTNPCPRCQPLLDTIAYNRARTPRRLLILLDVTARLSGKVFRLVDAARRKRR